MIRKIHQLTGHRAAVYALAAGDEAGTFFSAGGDGWIVRWSLADVRPGEEVTGRLVAKVDAQVFSLAYLPLTHTVVAGDMHGGVHWLNLNEDRPNRHLARHQRGTYDVVADGDTLLTLGGDGIITRWDTLRQRGVESLQLTDRPLRCAVPRASGREWLIGSSDHAIYRLGDDFSLLEHFPAAHDNSVFRLLPHPTDDAAFLSGGRDAQLKAWRTDPAGRTTLQSARPAHWFTINDLIASLDGRYIFSASRDKTVRIWTAADLELLQTLDAVRDGGHVNSVNRLLWVPDTPYLVSASDDRTVIVWEVL